MEAITEALADLDRDELILRFVSQEFASVLTHYQNAPDINVTDKGRGQNTDYQRPDSRFSRQERPESKFGRQDDRGERVNFSRFYLNIGEKDGISPARLIGQINDASGSASIKVGRIEILDHTAMLEADSRFAQKVLEVFHGLKINGRDVEVKTLDAPKGRPAKPAYPGRKGANPTNPQAPRTSPPAPARTSPQPQPGPQPRQSHILPPSPPLQPSRIPRPGPQPRPDRPPRPDHPPAFPGEARRSPTPNELRQKLNTTNPPRL